MQKRSEYFTVRCDGYQLSGLRLWPDRTPHGTLIFVHGASKTSEAVFDRKPPARSAMEHFADRGFCCVCFDHRGFGRSFVPGSIPRLGIRERTRDLLAILEEQERVLPGPKHLLGFSLGGITVLDLLRRKALPRSVDRSILLTVVAFPASRRSLLWLLRPFRRLFRTRYRCMSRERMIRRKLRGAAHLANAFTREAVEGEYEQLREIGPIGPSGEYMYPSFRGTRLDVVRVLITAMTSVPILIVRGEFDTVCTESGATWLADKIGRDKVTVAVVPDSGHDIVLFRPDYSLDLMHRFLCEDAANDLSI